MRIILIGSGPSALYFSIYHKLHNTNDEILIIEKSDKIAKKLYATGNGRCNLGNNKISFNTYNNEKFYEMFKEKLFLNLKEFSQMISVKLSSIDNYYYPSSFSSSTYADYLINLAKSLNVSFLLNEEFIDYENFTYGIKVLTNKNTYTCGKIIFASGGKSSPNLGSDGKLFNVFKKHGYDITLLRPGLCKIFIKERIILLENLRLKANVSIINKLGQTLYGEEGEVLFKKDSLSGICIFNLSSFISRKNLKDVKIKINPLINVDNNEINNLIKIQNKLQNYSVFNAIYPKNFVDYINKRINANYQNKDYVKSFIDELNNLIFNYDYLDNFNNSQVTIGGINTKCLDNFVKSKIENNVYFIGEVVDIDGLCGGYNLMYDLTSAIEASKELS